MASTLPQFVSLGAGVQSSALALMAAKGEIGPMPAGAVFADTGDEAAATYRWLDHLEKLLPFPIHRVQKGVVSRDSLVIRRSKKSGRLYLKTLIPAFVLQPNGKVGLLGRKCTPDYKVAPILKKLRALANIRRGQKDFGVQQWIGISTDEAHRMKPCGEPWCESVWPLIDRRLSRTDAAEWLVRNGYGEPPRSACVFCPFHSDYEWARLKSEHPEDFRKACVFERQLQEHCAKQETLRGLPFLHKSCVPLPEVKFRDSPSHPQVSLFGNECEGLCGV